MITILLIYIKSWDNNFNLSLSNVIYMLNNLNNYFLIYLEF